MKHDAVPPATIKVFARSIFDESVRYGFSQVDLLRLINELMDLVSTEPTESADPSDREAGRRAGEFEADSFPLRSSRLSIRLAQGDSDVAQLNDWMQDEYGRHFVLSAASAQSTDIGDLLANEQNRIGMVCLGSRPIGAVAYLDIDDTQKRAELRKLIGERDVRGEGYAEEATRLWIEYGFRALGLEKIYVSTLQTHLRNVQLNESIGFRVEGLLKDEARIGSERYSVLRMGLSRSQFDGS